MTTQEAERRYEAQRLKEHQWKAWEVHNPCGRPEDELPVIYGFNNGGKHGFMSACLIAEDGTELGGHCCASEAYMPHDLGILKGSRLDRHEEFQKHYPKGYRMEFVGHSDVRGHEKLMAAINIATTTKAQEPQDQNND